MTSAAVEGATVLDAIQLRGRAPWLLMQPRACALGCSLWLLLAFVGTGPAVGQSVCKDADDNCFEDDLGRLQLSREAYLDLHKERKAHWLLGLAEETVFLAVGTTWYWLAKDKNLVDWDRPSAKQRFSLDVIRFDNNDFPINYTLHPWSGAAYYAAARTTGSSILVSSVYAVGSSVVWEYGIEFREKVSISDLIFTPAVGVSIGEFFSRLGLYVNRPAGKAGVLQRIAGVVFGPMQAFSDAVTGERSVAKSPPDDLGLSSALFHSFRAHAGFALQKAGRHEAALSDFGVGGAFVAIPSYRRKGRFRRFLRDGDFTRLWLSFIQGGGQREFDSYADMTLFGIYEQRIDQGGRGGSVFLGSSLGYRYRRSLLDGFRDEVAAVHLPGLAVNGSLFPHQRVDVHLSARVHSDAAAIRSLSYPRWQRAYPEAMGKTTLSNHGYLNAFGLTTVLEASVGLDRMRFGGRAWFALYNSKEGLDRNQEALTADPKGFDKVLDGEGYASVSPFRHRAFMAELAVLGRRRESRLGGYETRRSLVRASLRIGLVF